MVEQFGMRRSFAEVPKLLGVPTRPLPKWCCQTRLTITRAVSGLSLLAMASASSSRPLPLREPRAARRPPGCAGTAAAPRRLAVRVAADVDFMSAGLPSVSAWAIGRAGGDVLREFDRPLRASRSASCARPDRASLPPGERRAGTAPGGETTSRSRSAFSFRQRFALRRKASAARNSLLQVGLKRLRRRRHLGQRHAILGEILVRVQLDSVLRQRPGEAAWSLPLRNR